MSDSEGLFGRANAAFGRARARVSSVMTTGRMLLVLGIVLFVAAAIFGYVKDWKLSDFNTPPAGATGMQQMTFYGGLGGGAVVAAVGVFTVAMGSQ